MHLQNLQGINECVKYDSRRHGDEEIPGKSVPSVRVVTSGWDFEGLVAKETPATGRKAAAQRQADFQKGRAKPSLLQRTKRQHLGGREGSGGTGQSGSPSVR